jgi:hypothetical protein
MGEQNSACGAASNEITSTLQKNPWKSWKDNSGELSGADFSSDVRIEEVGTSKARPAAISDSYYNLNSSEFMELCIISNPASDGEEVQEARDQVVCSTPYICCSCSADWFSCGHCLTIWLSTDRKLRNKILHLYLQLQALITRKSAGIVLV